MRQLTLASASFDKHSKQTRRAKFLAEMDQVVPWRELCAVSSRLPKGWQRPATDRPGAHAAPPLPAALVQSVRPRSGGVAV